MILAIYGGGGLGRETLELARQIKEVNNCWNEICFIDDVIESYTINDVKRYTFKEFIGLYNYDEARFIIALGEPQLRKMLYNRVINQKYEFETLVHPNVYVPKSTYLGSGVVIGTNAFVSCNCVIEDNTFIQPNSQIGHDSIIKESCVISSFSVICGHCVVGEESFIGVQSAVREKTSVGSHCIIGMGSNVIGNIPNNAVAVGNPARVIRSGRCEKVFKYKKKGGAV